VTHFSEMIENNPDTPHRNVVLTIGGAETTLRVWTFDNNDVGIDIATCGTCVESMCTRDQLRAVMLAIGQALAETKESPL
jgi:hypothetical protein